MTIERIDLCTACGGRLEKKGDYWVCRHCGAIYSIGHHHDGAEFTYPVAPPKELPCGQIAVQAAQISVDKITVKEIKPLQSIESDVYRESVNLSYNDNVKLIKIYLEEGNWDTAQDRIYGLRNLNDPCSIAAATWYSMAFARQAHDDEELVRALHDISDAEIADFDNIFPSAMPDFRKHILDLLLSDGYVGDEATAKIIAAILPYVFNETIYSVEERNEKIEYAFDNAISLGYPQTFKYLLSHTLEKHEVARYISYLERFAKTRTHQDSQEYYSMIIAVDPGNLSAHRCLVKADIASDSATEKCIADFERLISYSDDPKAEVYDFLSRLVDEETTTEAKTGFVWSLLGYYHEDEDTQKAFMFKYADLLLQSGLWKKAADFYSTVLSKDTHNAIVYFKLCLADRKARSGEELIEQEEDFSKHPYYNKALAIADDSYTRYLRGLPGAQKKRIENEKRKKEAKRRNTIIGFISLVVMAAMIVGFVLFRNKRNHQRYDAENIVITIVDKEEYSDILKIKIENNSILDIHELVGDMEIYNAADTLLIETTCTFTGELAAGEEGVFDLTVNSEENDEFIEFCCAAKDDLKITFKLTSVTYEDNDKKEYNEDAVTILELKNSSDDETDDGTDPTDDGTDEEKQKETAYNNALALYAEEKYDEAINILIELGDYKDSYEKCLEIVAAAEAKAESLANTGDYAGAFALLDKLGYDESSDAYVAYYYADQGDFATAVEYGLTTVIIPEGVASIPDNYLYTYGVSNNLKKVVLPASVKSIGKAAFAGCSKLQEINLPAGLVAINESTFSGCSSLTKIVLPESLKVIGKNAFSSCSSLTDIQFPENLTSIGDNAFQYCDMLINLELPDSLNSLGNYAFRECSGLLTVSIAGGVHTIGEYAFQHCEYLVEVTIADGVEVIGAYAFYDCLMLTTVSLPDSLKEIKNNAFYECTSLSTITMPAQLVKIHNYAFYGCSALQTAYFTNTSGWLRNSALAVDFSDPQTSARWLVNNSSNTYSRS